MNLREYSNDSGRSVADWLPYECMVDDRTIRNKDGSFSTGWSYRGEDLGSSSISEMFNLSQQINAAINRWGSGFMVHFDVIRDPSSDYPVGALFPDRTSWIIDEERRTQYESAGLHYETTFAVVLTWLPQNTFNHSLAKKAFKNVEESDESLTSDDANLKAFHQISIDFEDSLSRILYMTRMVNYEDTAPNGVVGVYSPLLRHIERCITGVDAPMLLPNPAAFLDAYLGNVDVQPSHTPIIGNRHVRAISISIPQQYSSPGMIDNLFGLPASYRFSTRFIFLDPLVARKQIEAHRRGWRGKRFGFIDSMLMSNGKAPGRVNNDAVNMADDAQLALDILEGNEVRFGFYTPTIILADENKDRVNALAREFLKRVNDLGFRGQIEEVNAVAAWIGAIPAKGYANQRRPLIHTRNAADLFPTTALWSGQKKHPSSYFPVGSQPIAILSTDGETPFRLFLHVNQVGHTLISGPTGSGKTTLLNFLAASQMRYPNAQVFHFDKGHGALKQCLAMGGEHYDVTVESRLGFCPLQDVTVEDVRERAWAENWVESLFEVQGIKLTPSNRKEIHEAILALCDGPGRSITDLQTNIQDEELRHALLQFTLEGKGGNLLDSATDGLGDDFYQVFEMQNLLSNENAMIGVPVLKYIFHRIEARLNKDRPSMIILDEAWTMLANPVFSAKIDEWLRELRKFNCQVIFATQSVNDIVKSPISDILQQSCPVKIFLPNPEATTTSASKAYQEMNCTDQEILILKTAIPGLHYYIKSSQGRRLCNLELGPIALTFMADSDGNETLKHIRALEELHGSTWPAELLRAQKNVKGANQNTDWDGWADLWLEGQNKRKARNSAPTMKTLELAGVV